jgi:hypothetical protein
VTSDETGVGSCEVALPDCESAAVDGGDLSVALDASDVIAAFTFDEAVVLGLDTRASDGLVKGLVCIVAV